uniref:Helicase-associated domain-containing protein n=1 Tax=Globisporangium ultimum (strain ATCC 200006 / CBS 805.95 / DAOM BR144) TaxID=431595 RepID=K3WZY4_GLOUD
MEQGDSEDVIVPHHLQHESWSKELHGMRLGVKVHKFVQAVMKGTHKQSAKQLAQLTELGFPWSDWREYVFENVTVPALETYLQKEGHLFVPQKFVCPHGDQTWPRPTWGFPLGTQVATLRKHKDTSLLADHHVEVLGQMGFVWKVRDAKWFQYFLPGLRHYKSVYGHVDVPLAFVIPDQQQSSSTSLQQGDEGNAEWPVYLGGYMLGRHVYMVRSGKYADQVEESRAELNALGFSFNLSDSMWTHTILPALRVFAQVHRHCDVHQEFVVPSWAPWPEKAWGLKLGHTVKSIRQGAYEAQVQASRDDLERLGFVWNAKQRLERTVRDIVLPAMATYRKLHGHVLISTDFVVPKNDAAWPEFARGFKLGHWITRARSGHVDVPSHLRRELDHVGFVWRFNDARWNEILLPSFRVYAKLHGTCHGMSTKFHVPHEPPYPEQAWGANLGGAVWHMRNGDTYVNDDEKQRELRALGVLE